VALIRVVTHKVWDYRCHMGLQLTFENVYHNICIVYIYICKITLNIGFVLLSTHHMFTTFIKLFQIWFQERFHKGLTKLFHFLKSYFGHAIKVGGINCTCQLWSRSFPPIKAQGEPKVVTPKFQNTLNFSTYQQTKTCYIKTQIYKSNALIPGREFWLLKLQMLEWVSWQRSIYQSTNQCGFS